MRALKGNSFQLLIDYQDTAVYNIMLKDVMACFLLVCVSMTSPFCSDIYFAII